MNTLTFVTGFALLLCAPPLGEDAQLLFAPPEDSQVVRTFTETSSFALDSMTQTAAGQEMEQDLPDLDGTNTRHTKVTDQFIKIADGRPVKLKRTFDEIMGETALELSFDGQTEAYEYELESELKGAEALFTWNSEEETYELTDAEGNPRDDFEGLSEDMDLRGLLPEEKVEKFGSWEIAPQVLVDAFRTGGDKLLAPEAKPDGDYFALTPMQVMGASLIGLSDLQEATGEVDATWDDTEKREGTSFALITLEFSISGVADGTERTEFLLDAIGADVTEEDLDVAVEAALEGEAQLVWNLDQNRIESFTLESNNELTVIFSWSQNFGQNSIEVEVEAILTGESQFELSIE